MIGAMYLGMAIRAALPKQLLCGTRRRHASPAVQGAWVEHLLMAALAQKWLSDAQQTSLRRPVRVMAIGAILGHRLVFPQEWSAFFRVTLRAGFQHIAGREQIIRHRTM